MILNVLTQLEPNDPILSQPFEVQDELYLEIRRLIVQRIPRDETLRAEFDRLLNAHRINVMRVSQTLRPLSEDRRSLD